MSGPMQVAIKDVKWQDPSKFSISFTGAGTSVLSLPEPRVLSMACTGIQLAEIATTPIEQYVAEEWRFAIGRLENYQISIGFKDFNNFTLYKKWANAIQEFLRMYPDDQKFNVDIMTADDFNPNELTPIVSFKDCILIAVGAPQLDNSAVASVAEFSVTIKCSYADIK